MDIGCAGGDFLFIINKTLNPKTAVGFDFIERIIHQGRHRYQDLNFAVASLPEIPIQKGTVDLVIASEVLYYLSKKEQKQTMKKIHDILTPQGYFFFASTIGKKYFTETSARNLISPYFIILKVKYLHSGLYNKTISLLYRVVRLSELIRTGEEPGNQKFNKSFKQLKRLLDHPLGRFILSNTARAFEKVLFSLSLPAACEAIGKRFGSTFQSNIIIVAQRNDNDSC